MKTLSGITSALALLLATHVAPPVAAQANAEITQDCILEGTVNQTRAASGGEAVHLVFRSAERGEQAPCRMSRVDRSRRIQFKVPSDNDIVDAPHGSKVKYRYTEDVEGKRQWRLIDRRDDMRL
ncbi:MAG: hypothetical protein ABR612_09290 [Chromatocurvus sp.]